MQASRSLFQAAFKDPNQPVVRGVSRSRPFLDAWAPTSTVQKRGVAMASATTFFDFQPLDKKGQPVDLGNYKGKVVLVFNGASKCGFTPQYADLEKLYKKIKPEHPDFEIVGFPSNQFGNQDPGSNDEIQEFCQVNYGVTFKVLGKTEVNGAKAEPVWDWMKKERPGILGLKRIKWNFEKFLIGRDGKVIERWASMKKPGALESAVLKALADGQSEAPKEPAAIKSEL